jgi:hypothetical protein
VGRDTLVHQFRIAAGLPLVLLGATTIAALVMVLRRRPDRATGIVGLAAVGLLIASYVATPYSAVGTPGDPFIAAANVRYGVPGLVAAVGLAGWATARLTRRGLVVLEVAALLAFVDALQIGTTLTHGQTALAFLIAIPLLLLWPLAPRVRDALRRAPAALPTGVVTLLVVVAVVGVGRYEHTYNSRRFAGLDPALDWVRQNTADGERVGIAGAWTDRGVAPIYPAFGEQLQNDVTYIGPEDDGLLDTYTSESSYVGALERSDVEVLIVGRAEPYLPEGTEAASSAEIEAWSVANGYTPVAQSDRLTVLVHETK